MKKLMIFILVFATMCLGFQALIQAQEATGQAQEPAGEMMEPAQLSVSVAAICQNVVDREPVDAGISFAATVGKLYCFTKIIGAESPTQIAHVWYFDGNERARVDLAINAASWRTFSSKIIQPHELGAWRVDVMDAEGNVLKTLEFEVTP
ncbi:MAG: DUF2914 domain-containing protein [Deltaproteobacteria bacterium]|nr:MAG: DUF2914 domain-containing protein [Deltaproteobacteria bacterium]